MAVSGVDVFPVAENAEALEVATKIKQKQW